MYKILIFLRKTGDESLLLRLQKSTVPKLEKLAGEKIGISEIEGAMLTEEKYFRFCEAEFAGKEDLDRKMQTPEGKELNKELASYGGNISVFYANYGDR